jgi:hypothetical protein
MVFTFARVSAACGMNVADLVHGGGGPYGRGEAQLNGERLNRINA